MLVLVLKLTFSFKSKSPAKTQASKKQNDHFISYRRSEAVGQPAKLARKDSACRRPPVDTKVNSCSPYMYLAGTAALQPHQMPIEVEVRACDKPEGNSSVFASCAQIQTTLAAHKATPEAARKQAATSS